MAGTHAKAVRRANVLQRLSSRLGIEQADMRANGKGDREMALIITLERIADAVDAKVALPEKSKAKAKAQVDADSPLTIETVEIVPPNAGITGGDKDAK